MATLPRERMTIEMRTVDRWLQLWRWSVARRWIEPGSRLLDIGCHEGKFFEFLDGRIQQGVGVDPLTSPRQTPRFCYLSQCLNDHLDFPDATFDAITLLATLEHIQQKEPLARECHRLLREGGRVILTVPSPRVDRIVGWFRFLRLADGMCIDQHHGFHPADTVPMFVKHGFILECEHRFQFGLNNLFVFRK